MAGGLKQTELMGRKTRSRRMDRIYSDTPRPGVPAVLASLAGAALAGTAASVIHGAFHRATRPAVTKEPQHLSSHASRPAESGKAGAASPSDIPAPGWWAILKRTISEVSGDRVLAVSGGVTFYALLSLFPAITVLVSLYGLFAAPQSIAQHLEMLSTFLPEGAMSIIGEQVQRIAGTGEGGLGIAAAAGLLVALWSSNSAVKAMMDALNVAYDVEEKRGFVRLNLLSLLFTLSAMLGLIVMIALVAIVPAFLQMVHLGGMADLLLWAGRWPVAFLLIVLALAVLYQWGPCRPGVRWRWITPGSLVAALALVVFSMLFSWYAANFGKFNETYGSLGAAIAFMTWMWLSATIILTGAELNSEVENQARSGGKPGEPDEKQA